MTQRQLYIHQIMYAVLGIGSLLLIPLVHLDQRNRILFIIAAITFFAVAVFLAFVPAQGPSPPPDSE